MKIEIYKWVVLIIWMTSFLIAHASCYTSVPKIISRL